MIGSRFQIDINEANPELNAPLIRSPGLTFESKYGELQSTNHLVLTFFFFLERVWMTLFHGSTPTIVISLT